MPMRRTVTLVVVDANGEVRGALPSFTVGTPWWQDLEPIRAAYPDLTVLRLLDGVPESGTCIGGTVRYLAQADRVPPRLVAAGDVGDLVDDHPLRMPWARPGGPAADLEWAA